MHALDQAIESVLTLCRVTTVKHGACYNCGFIVRPGQQPVCLMPKPEDAPQDLADALAVAAQRFGADAIVVAQQTRIVMFAGSESCHIDAARYHHGPQDGITGKPEFVDALTFWIDKGAGTRIVTQELTRDGDKAELGPPVDLGTEADSTGMFANLMHGGYAAQEPKQ